MDDIIELLPFQTDFELDIVQSFIRLRIVRRVVGRKIATAKRLLSMIASATILSGNHRNLILAFVTITTK